MIYEIERSKTINDNLIKGHIYQVEFFDGKALLFIFDDFVDNDAISVSPLAATKEVSFNTKMVSFKYGLSINYIFKEVPKEELPLYVGWPTIMPLFMETLNEI